MSDAEISYQLALAIGWRKNCVKIASDECFDCPEIRCYVLTKTYWRGVAYWEFFDYRKADVIWPIAERYNAFPCRLDSGGWTACVGDSINPEAWAAADTAAKAVALAVIWSKG